MLQHLHGARLNAQPIERAARDRPHRLQRRVASPIHRCCQKFVVAIEDSLDSLAEGAAEEQRLDRRRAVERVHDLIWRLRPLDRQVMLLYLEQLDAASIAEISVSAPERLGLSCVDFYRAQLVHQQNLAGQSMRYLLPFVPGVTVSPLHGVVGEGLTTGHRIGVVASGIALFGGVALVNARTIRNVQREVDAIDAR